MRRFQWLGLAAFGLIIPVGCNLLFPPNSETGSSELKQFTSAKDLSDYFHAQIRARNGVIPDFNRALSEAAPGAPSGDGDFATGGEAPPQAVSDDAGFSGTTIQEAGVDESDVIKTDGAHFYMLDSRYDATSTLRIVQASPIDELAVLSETEIEGYGQDIYLRDGTAVVITTGGGTFFYLGGGGFADDGVAVSFREDAGQSIEPSDDSLGGVNPPAADDMGIDIDIAPPFGGGDYEYVRPYTVVTIVNVADPAAPSVGAVVRFDGTPTSSRMIDGVLHMVLANYQNYYYDVMPMLGRPELAVEQVDVDTLLPSFERVLPGGRVSGGNLVTWENLYHPIDPDGFGVVTVVSLDTESPEAEFSSVGIVAEPGLIYSSRTALYLTDTNYNFGGQERTTTDIYKLAYDGASATPVASGSVPGRILNQYSMSEHQGHLRVASTIDPTFFFGLDGFNRAEPVNGVYVLSHNENELSIVGRAEDIAPGETIQSARFAGNRGYLVTFLQIDPLFTLDLSDPADPQVIGELKVPGFSTFLTPMGEDHLLAVGQYVPPPGEFGVWGVQLSIFDVSDFANPVLRDNVVLGGDNQGSYSEALWNPKAFTYFADEDVVALPISVYGGFFIEDRPGLFDGDAVVSNGGGTDGNSGDADAPPPDDDIDDVVDSDPGSADLFAPEGFEGVVVFRATPEDGLLELGRISTRFDTAGFFYPSFSRGVFIGDKVYAVTNKGLRVADLQDVSQVDAELMYGNDDDAFKPQPLPELPPDGGDVPVPDIPSDVQSGSEGGSSGAGG